MVLISATSLSSALDSAIQDLHLACIHGFREVTEPPKNETTGSRMALPETSRPREPPVSALGLSSWLLRNSPVSNFKCDLLRCYTTSIRMLGARARRNHHNRPRVASGALWFLQEDGAEAEAQQVQPVRWNAEMAVSISSSRSALGEPLRP